MRRSLQVIAAVGLVLMPTVCWAQGPTKYSAMKQTAEAAQNVGKPTKGAPPPDYVPYDQAPEPINQVTPKYPDLATRAGMEGTVWVRLWIDEMGRVAKAEILKSDAEIFNQPSLDAGKQWLFRPAMSKGKPVAVWVSIPFRFKLAGYPSETTSVGSLKQMVISETRHLGIPELVLILCIVGLFWLVPLVFVIVALVSILRSQFPGPNDKLIWTVVAILVPIVGPILYFIIGMKQRVQTP
jgi:TonB family protein